MKKKIIFAGSFVALLAVSPALADIASVNYVQTQVGAKSAKAAIADAGQIAAVTATGEFEGSGVSAQDLADAIADAADAAADAASALTTANTAATDASTALTNAASAQTTAGNAQTTANTAAADAASAVTTANAAQAAVANKADKVSSATNGNLAGLDASGNLTDSGVAAAGVATQAWVGTQGYQTSSQVSSSITTAIANKANSADVYTKTAADAAFAVKGTETVAATAATAATAAQATADAAAADIGTKANLTTTAKGDLVSAVNEVNAAIAGKVNATALGALAAKDTVATADIDANAVTKERLSPALLKALADMPAACQGTDVHCALTIVNGTLSWEVVVD
jgi:hypothetical protein